MKKFINAFLFSMSVLGSCGAYAMSAKSVPGISLAVSNQTASQITIMNSPKAQVIKVPSLDDATIMLQLQYSVLAEEGPMTIICTSKGLFTIDYNVLYHKLWFFKDGKLIKELSDPKTPIIIFEEGEDMPTITERDAQ